MQKLPVIETVKDAVGYTLSNISLFAKASMFWVALYTVLVALFALTGGDDFLAVLQSFYEKMQSVPVEQNLATMQLIFDEMLVGLANLGSPVNWLFVGMFFVKICAVYSLAIVWHRACLLDEKPPLVHLGMLELKYFAYTFLLMLIFYAIYLVLSIVSMILGGAVLVFQLIIIVALLLAFGRFNLVFPGIAVRDRRMNLRSSWGYSRGNSWYILGGTILCLLPYILAFIILTLVSQISLPIVLSMPIKLILELLSGAFLLSFMSICYQFFVPSPDEGDLA